MEIVEKKPVPIYESTCPECKSVFRYKKTEVSWLHITCPVCGVSMWAETIPVETDDCVGCISQQLPMDRHGNIMKTKTITERRKNNE